MTKPEYLYHYTSIETLALILKSKSIRFTPLTNVDDINETQFADEDLNISEYSFISCWSDNEDESLPFWNMYTPNMKGIRIKLPSEIFEEYTFTTENVDEINGSTQISCSITDKSEYFNEKYWALSWRNYLYKIIYTEDQSKLSPKIFEIQNENFNAKLNDVGLYKSKIWEFQSEWRFKINILPCYDNDGKKINPLINFYDIIKNKIKCPLDSYFIKIKDSTFEKMEITLGPKSTLAEEIIVESLIEKFNPTAKLSLNRLKGIIK